MCSTVCCLLLLRGYLRLLDTSLLCLCGACEQELDALRESMLFEVGERDSEIAKLEDDFAKAHTQLAKRESEVIPPKWCSGLSKPHQSAVSSTV